MGDFIVDKDPVPVYPYNYRGVVVDDVDPLNAGRVRVKVYPMFKDLANSVIPWAVPAPPVFSGAGSGYGEYATPEIGSWVFVFFEAGDFQQPVYFASAPSAQVGLPTERAAKKKVIKTKAGIVISVDDVTHEIKVSQPTGGASITITSDGKFLIGNSVAELLDVLSQFIGDWQTYYTAGTYGNVFYNPALAADLLVLKTKIDALKGA